MAGLSGASGRRCSISGVRSTRQPVKPSLRPSPLTDIPWPRLLMSGGVWLRVVARLPGRHRSLYPTCVSGRG